MSALINNHICQETHSFENLQFVPFSNIHTKSRVQTLDKSQTKLYVMISVATL